MTWPGFIAPNTPAPTERERGLTATHHNPDCPGCCLCGNCACGEADALG